MKVEVCDGCHKEPTSFASEDGVTLWYIVLDKDGEAAHLMSDFTYKFLASEERYPEREEGREYYCVTCLEKINETTS